MFEKINEDILELKERLRKNKKLESSKRIIEEELEKNKIQQKQLEKNLKKEKKDVEKLEKLSLSSIFISLIGRKEEKFDKEKEEYLMAKLKYDESIRQTQDLESKLEYTNKLLREHSQDYKAYDELLKQKEDLLISEGGEIGSQLKNELLKLDEITVDIKEIKEAITTGRTALSSLDNVIQKLESAKGWGTWDMLGGGFISNMAKHSAINEANSTAQIVQYDLKVFRKELSDVNEFTDIQVELSSFASFADFFLDGIFVDWFVQSKINDSLNNANGASRKVEAIIEKLNKNLIILENSRKQSEFKIKDILEV